MELRIGDCRQVLANIADNSVALVLTDPPYPAEAEPLYHWLAEFAARVLIPGGSLICYTGHWSLNRDTRIFDAKLCGEREQKGRHERSVATNVQSHRSLNSRFDGRCSAGTLH
jgi:predicted methyltransferase